MLHEQKILLINPPCNAVYKHLRQIMPKYPPLGLAYLASYLEKNSIRAEIYDSFAEEANFDQIKTCIEQSKASAVGLTGTTTTFNEVIQIAEYAKKMGKLVIVGGPHFSAIPKIIFEKYPCFDYGMVGEGEITLTELLQGKDIKSINGLVYRKDCEIVINSKRELIGDLSILPNPALDLLNLDLYKASENMFFKEKKFFTLLTARGCPYQCTFCASKIMWGNKLRYRPIEKIKEELEYLKQKGIKQIQIIDDTFTLDIDRVKTISKILKDLSFIWGCGTRVDSISEEILKTLKENGCIFIEFGIESGDQDLLNSMKKGIKLEDIEKAVKLTKKYGIKTNCSFILGYIGETEKTAKKTIGFAKKLCPDFAQFNIFTPYPGTEAFEIASKKGYVQKDFTEYKNPKFSDPVIALPGLSPEKLKKLLLKANVSFFLNPKYLLKTLAGSMMSITEMKRYFRLSKAFVKIFS